ncbi:hypothetical protein BC830DRAFT_1172960 [Chytriomyces sp. MP71]|nr:hypothetical protein BC830DRAFT_1172960 [Chytriomyces sp. MP71]
MFLLKLLEVTNVRPVGYPCFSWPAAPNAPGHVPLFSPLVFTEELRPKRLGQIGQMARNHGLPRSRIRHSSNISVCSFTARTAARIPVSVACLAPASARGVRAFACEDLVDALGGGSGEVEVDAAMKENSRSTGIARTSAHGLDVCCPSLAERMAQM